MEDGLVQVPLGPCTCPGTPHEADEVYLRPKLGMARSLAIIRTLPFDDMAVTEMQLALGYARFGIAAWNLSNGTGKPMEVDGEHLTKFAEEDPRAYVVAMRGDALYADEVLAPLLSMAATSSATSPASDETSATSGTKPSGKRRRRPSKPSSTTTTQTGDIVTITASLDGDSSS